MCFPSAVVCSGARTFLLPERMLQMSANESWENDLAWGSCVTVDSSVLRGAPQLGHIWLICDSEGLAAASDGEVVLAGGRHWVAAVVRRLSVLVRESAKRHAICHFLIIRCSHFGRKAVKLYGCFCWRLSDISLHLSAVLLWPGLARAHPTP